MSRYHCFVYLFQTFYFKLMKFKYFNFIMNYALSLQDASIKERTSETTSSCIVTVTVNTNE